MSLERSQRIAIKGDPSRGGLDVQPQDYFVLSRIEGTPSVGEVLDSAGLPPAQTQQSLERLLDVGAIECVDASRVQVRRPRGASPSADRALRDKAAKRRRQTLARGLGGPPAPRAATASEATTKTGTVESPKVGTGEHRKLGTGETHQAGEGPKPFVLPPVPAYDRRLDSSLAIAVEEQRRLLALVDRGDELTPFEMLGLHPTDDAKTIRNAFHQASRRFHPDAYHGKDLGPFSALLSQLFTRAKAAVKQLGNDEYRRPVVAAYEAERASAAAVENLKRERMHAAKAAAEEIRGKREREEVGARRKARTRGRALAQRGRVLDNLQGRVNEHLTEAQKAERLGNLPAAANHYRLALRINPDQPDVKAKWEEVRTIARKERAKEAFSRANAYLQLGQSEEALPLLVEAADADPTPEHLATAADLLRSTDSGRARQMAMEALNGLNRGAEDPNARSRSKAKLASLHLMLGRTFLDAGQKQTASVQGKLAQELTPDNPEVRALLKSIKVK